MKILRLFTLLFAVLFTANSFAQSYEIERAKSLIDAREYKSAAIILRPLAERGNAEAQYLVSKLFFVGDGVIKSEPQAVKYLKMSAQQYYEMAVMDLNDYYMKKKRYADAYKVLKNAYDHEQKPVYSFFLGAMSFYGLGTTKDVEKGWRMMYKMRKTPKDEIMVSVSDSDYPLLDFMEKPHMELCDYLLATYCVNGQESLLVDKIMREFGNEYSEPKWTDNLASKFTEKLHTFSPEMQRNIFNLLLKSNATVFQCYVAGYMSYKGLGTTRNAAVAKRAAGMISKYVDSKMPFMYNFIQEMNNLYKDIVMNDIRGKERRLSEWVGNGNYVLVDFWASWCKPCRDEIPNIVAAYEKYHAKGFDVVGISFDQSDEAWKTAIIQMGMKWHHISDLKGWKSTASKIYGVRSIPSNILVDGNGKIVATNLRGEALQEKLTEIYE